MVLEAGSDFHEETGTGLQTIPTSWVPTHSAFYSPEEKRDSKKFLDLFYLSSLWTKIG